MTINFSNKADVRALGAEIESALAGVAKAHGITIGYGGGSYSAGSATIKLECTNLGENGESIAKHTSDFLIFCKQYGLAEEDLGTMVEVQGILYALDGLMPNRPTRPVVMKRVGDGKIFIFDRKILPKIIAKRPVKAEA